MIDNYTFKENDADGLGIELNINYYRYFEAKGIVEAYMLFFIEETLYLHPIYFYNRFVTDPDFQPYIYAVSNSLEKWTSLKWINTDSAPNAFAEARSNAYHDIRKDLFYQQTTLNDKDNDHGIYFDTSIEVPECW